MAKALLAVAKFSNDVMLTNIIWNKSGIIPESAVFGAFNLPLAL